MGLAQTPSIEILTSGVSASLRGLSVVNDNIVWVSGTNGTVGKSTNGGKNWKWVTVAGFEKTDFRDIEAFDAHTAVIMGIGEPAYILKTIDGGETWKVVYENKTKGIFLDAMDFSDNQIGVVVGDPINGKIFMARTENSGNSWEEVDLLQQQTGIDTGEAFFAASGSNLRLFSDGTVLLVSGGKKSRLFTHKSTAKLDMLQGKESTGANSIDVYDNGLPRKAGKRMVIVGGDFHDENRTEGNCLYTTNGGKKWKKPVTPPSGYRSCVEYLSQKHVITCGISGVDYSTDAGKNWKNISTEGFHVCRIAKIGRAVFLAGRNGKIAKLVLPEDRQN